MTEAPPPRRCVHCAFPPVACLCAEIPRLRPGVEVTLVRHAAELTKTTGSARWAALALGRPVVGYALEGAPLDETTLPLEGAWLLFPTGRTEVPPGPPPKRLYVPDGTWQQARRMVARLPSLRGLPKLSLPPAPATPRLRVPLLKEGMSTIEAVAAALELLGDLEAARGLREVYEKAVGRVAALRGRGWKR